MKGKKKIRKKRSYTTLGGVHHVDVIRDDIPPRPVYISKLYRMFSRYYKELILDFIFSVKKITFTLTRIRLK